MGESQMDPSPCATSRTHVDFLGCQAQTSHAASCQIFLLIGHWMSLNGQRRSTVLFFGLWSILKIWDARARAMILLLRGSSRECVIFMLATSSQVPCISANVEPRLQNPPGGLAISRHSKDICIWVGPSLTSTALIKDLCRAPVDMHSMRL